VKSAVVILLSGLSAKQEQQYPANNSGTIAGNVTPILISPQAVRSQPTLKSVHHKNNQ